MTKIVENYVLEDLIGKGEYGDVYLAKHTTTKEQFAIKMLNFEKFVKTPKLQELIINEVQSLKKIDHKNVIKFYKLLKTQNHIYLVYEYCGHKSLDHLLEKQGFLQEQQALDIFKQIVDGFNIIHSFNIVHQDIKPENILFSENQQVKIADFGFCQIITPLTENSDLKDANQLYQQQKQYTEHGTPIYMAPEVMESKCQIQKNQDIYSLGYILYEMLYGCCPFEDTNQQRLLIKKQHDTIQFLDNKQQVSSKIKLLIQQMLNTIPEKRPTINEIYHQLFNEEIDNSNYIHETSVIQDNLERQSIQHEFGFDAIQNQQKQLQQELQKNTENMFQKNQINKNNSLEEDYYQISIKIIGIRNKTVYISNIMCAILDLNMNIDSVKACFLLLKQMLKIFSQIMQMLYSRDQQTIQQFNTTPSIWNSFLESSIFQVIKNMILQEEDTVKQNFQLFQIFYEQTISPIDSELILEQKSQEIQNEPLFKSLLIRYIQAVYEEAQYKISQEQYELGTKLLIHTNNILDCVDLDKFFNYLLLEKYINITNQPYFKILGGYDHIQLTQLVEAKLIKI